ncbi:MAG: hypothetical protein ACYTX0_62760, partial [Nostoc sp.]
RLSVTQQTPENVGLRNETQPTHFYFLAKTYAVLYPNGHPSPYQGEGQVLHSRTRVRFLNPSALG